MSMIEVRAAELSGAALDWSVAKANGYEPSIHRWDGQDGCLMYEVGLPTMSIRRAYDRWAPSRIWSQGGPLIEKYAIEFEWLTDARIRAFTMIDSGIGFGAGHLVAACRAIVAAKLGDVVQVPAELMRKPAP